MKEVGKKTDNTFKLSHYLIINVALKDITGSDGDVDFSTEMKVDYIKCIRENRKNKSIVIKKILLNQVIKNKEFNTNKERI